MEVGAEGPTFEYVSHTKDDIRPRLRDVEPVPALFAAGELRFSHLACSK